MLLFIMIYYVHSDAWAHYTDRNERKALSVIKQLCVYAVGKKKNVWGPSDAFCSLFIQFKTRLFVLKFGAVIKV